MNTKNSERCCLLILALLCLASLSSCPAPAGQTESYTITFDKNDPAAVGSMSPQTVVSGAHTTLAPCTFTKPGWGFNWWSTSPGGGVVYYDQDTFTMGNADVTLYAQWALLPTYTVHYFGNGATVGTPPTDNTAYYQGEIVTVLGNTGNLEVPGSPEYPFGGWNSASGGTGTTYAVGQTFSMPGAHVLLYSQWGLAASTLAGSVSLTGSTDATGTAARFNGPKGITISGTNLYVADTINHTVRKVVISTGVVSTLAGSAGNPGSTDATGSSALFKYPQGVAVAGGNLYVVESGNNTIRKVVAATGEVTTFAGSAADPPSDVDDVGTAARFNSPIAIATDGTNLYVAEYNGHTIRQIVIATADVTTLAGSAGSPGSTDDFGTAAKFRYPQGIAADGSNVYVADTGNHTVRQIDIATGEVTTLAGSAGVSGPEDATGASARFNGPMGIATDGTNLYVTDYGNFTIRRVVIATAKVTTLAGRGGSSGTVDSTGINARFTNLWGVATTDGAVIYIVDNNAIRLVK